MAISRPLAVAVAATALLVVVLGADASMDRSLHVDQRDAGGGWATVASQGEVPERDRYAYPIGPVAGQPVARNDSIPMRVRVENGYPLAFDETYVVRVNGAEVARGTLAAPARGSGASEFLVPVAKIAGGLREGEKAGGNQTGPNPTYYGTVEVAVGRVTLMAGVHVEVTS